MGPKLKLVVIDFDDDSLVEVGEQCREEHHRLFLQNYVLSGDIWLDFKVSLDSFLLLVQIHEEACEFVLSVSVEGALTIDYIAYFLLACSLELRFCSFSFLTALLCSATFSFLS